MIARFVAARTGSKTSDVGPRTTAWAMLSVALSAYESWLADESVTLHDALGAAFDVVAPGLGRIP